MSRILIALLLVVVACESQHVKSTYSNDVTICWTVDPGCSTIVYYRAYDVGAGEPLSSWKRVGVTADTNYQITRPINSKNVIFGLQSFVGDDTSEMHTSMDSDACMVGDSSSCQEEGWWALTWAKFTKPTLLKLLKF